MKKHPIQFQTFLKILNKRRCLLMVVALITTVHFSFQALILPHQTFLPFFLNSNPQFQQHNLQFAQNIHLGEIEALDLGQTTHELLSLDLSKNLGNVGSLNSSISIENVVPKGVNESRVGIRTRVLPINEKYTLFVSDDRKRMRCLMPPKSVMYKDQMDRLLVRHRRSSRAMRPRWSSARDQDIVVSKAQITNVPSRMVDQDYQLLATLSINN